MTHVLGNCIRRLTYLCPVSVDVMYVCHAIRRADRNDAERTAVDIKAHTPLIRFVVDLLYNKQAVDLSWVLWICCGLVVGDLVFVQNGESR